MSNKILAGIDEVGRGCLAGPVVSCVVILKENIKKKLLKDSKMISFKKRAFTPFPQMGLFLRPKDFLWLV